jgi:sulfonate transport system ATP-binding protein
MTKKFGDLLVLNDVSFDVKKGEFLCIVGPTGCGKTTFLNCITKLYEPTSGEILINGEPVN